MARKGSKGLNSPDKAVTADRAARLYRLLCLLGGAPQTRKVLTRKMHLGVRGFYRDLEVLRAAGITVVMKSRRYILQGQLKDALARLPFPDPKLSLGEAQHLARGRSEAHRKLKEQIAQIVG